MSKATLEARLTANGVPFIDDTIDGGHEWYTWRKLLHDYAANVAFRTTSVAVTTSGSSVTATVTPGTTEPVAPSGTVQFSAGGVPLGTPVPLVERLGHGHRLEHGRPGHHGDLQRRRVLQREQRLVPVLGRRGTVGGTVPATLR